MESQRRLESWKEISDYLERSIKTCQRWESVLDLPIHRLDGTPSARVFAYPDELDRWMAEKLKHKEFEAEQSALARPHKKKRAVIVSGVIATLAVIAILAWRISFLLPVSFPSTTPCTIFLPLENPSGDETLASWRADLPHLMTIDLVQSRVVGSMNPGALYRGLVDLKMWDYKEYSSEDMRKISQKLGCNYLISGTLARSGEKITMNLSLHDPRTSAVIRSFQMSCQGERGIFSMVDKFTPKFKHALNIPARLISHDIDDKSSRITTDSPEAFKAYCEADRLAWLDDKVQEASVLFRKAFDIDPEFAEAYSRLYSACFPILDKEEKIRIGTKAIALSDRLNIWSRYNLQGSFYRSVQKDYGKAIAAYEKLLTLMNDDMAGYRLAQIYWDQEEYHKAIPVLEKIKLIALDNESVFRLLAICYASAGDYDKATKVLDDYLVAHPKVTPNFLHIRAVYAADQSKFDEAITLMDKLGSLYPNSVNSVRYSKAPVFITQDDFAKAEEELRRIVDQGEKTEVVYALMGQTAVCLTQGKIDEARRRAQQSIELAKDLGDAGWLKMAHLNMAYLNRLSGNLPEALREAEEACRDYQDEGIYGLGALHLRALVTLEMDRMEEFEKRLAEIKELVEQEQYPKLMRAYFHLLGQRELRKGRIEIATDHFLKALGLLPSPMGKSNADIDSAQYFYSLADAYDRSGMWSQALDIFKKIPPYWEQRFNSGDIYALTFYRSGKLYELSSGWSGKTQDQIKDDRAKSIENYLKFLSLWKDADRLFAGEVEDAKARLATLEAK